METEVYLNNEFVGTIDNPAEFVSKLKEERRLGSITNNLNVFYDTKSNNVYIECSKGRARRPLIVVKDGLPLLTEKHIKQLEKNEISWSDLVKQGIIEYLDSMEEEDALVAFFENELTPKHTHLEIMPLAMFGYCTSLVPYGNFNQSTRLNAGSKNQKQALGLYASNFSVRMDMDVNVIHYPQVPVVQTIMHNISDYGKHPAGQNIVVAIMSYKGYNMEDAIIINRGSIERGFGRSTYYRPSIAEELRYAGGLMDEVCIPNKDIKGYKSEKDYRLLEEDGVIFAEAKVKEGDVVIGKTSPPRFLSSMEDYSLASSTRRESSINLKHGEEGVVDFVLITENEEGNKLIQVRLRDEPGVAEIIRVLNTGQVGLSEDLVAPTSRIIDSRHVHYDLNWSIKGYDYLKIVFHEELQPDVVIPSIAMAPYFTVSPDAFAWEGELAAYGETQRLSINTHLLDDFDTLLSVHRDQRYNTKGVTISVEEGGVTKEIVTYAEGGDINEVSGVEATIQ